ncbi:hypothetical protein [Sphingopyxis alaskensis]|jgi:hypothetical protein|uniref:hypothetical protein n=1 Tax=Sphingopyxis alaskensis TaxID=117207 RepID=UPI000320C57D|nr:hypothetical protein [Sphingopyxis alaskensis]MCM3419822.1 hypothetical protein [Sphingopyxis alaskensis]
MTPRRIAALLALTALMQPPVAVEARVLAVPSCGGDMQRTMLPGDPADPDRRRDCAKACHAATDRRGKGAAGRGGRC